MTANKTNFNLALVRYTRDPSVEDNTPHESQVVSPVPASVQALKRLQFLLQLRQFGRSLDRVSRFYDATPTPLAWRRRRGRLYPRVPGTFSTWHSTNTFEARNTFAI